MYRTQQDDVSQQETCITISSAGVVLTFGLLLVKLSVEKIVIRLCTAYGDKNNQKSNQCVFHLEFCQPRAKITVATSGARSSAECR